MFTGPTSWEPYVVSLLLGGMILCLADVFLIRRRAGLMFLLAFGVMGAAWAIYSTWGAPIDPRDAGRGDGGIVGGLLMGVLVVPTLCGYLATRSLLRLIRFRRG